MNIPYKMIDIFGGPRWDLLIKERRKNRKCLENFGYKVYSQNDEDGIIQEIFERIGTTNKQFVEFGAQDGLESNGHLLLLKGWKGLWLEGDQDYCEKIKEKFAPIIKFGKLRILNAFITKNNINALISEKGGVMGEIDLLSVDIDGNDYYVWDAINVINPRVVIVEYNGKFPPDVEWKMAYNSRHIWEGSDWQGASLKAYEILGRKKGYSLVSTNYRGVNAFFVRNDLVGNKFINPFTAEALYNPFRLNVQYFSGHPDRYCLANQKEELGIYNYVSHDDICPNYGFFGKEYSAKGDFSWISSKESEILCFADPGLESVTISYFNVDLKKEVKEKEEHQDEILAEPMTITAYINGEKVVEKDVKMDGKDSFDIPIPKELTTNQVIAINLKCSSLWVPAEKLKINDFRKLGVAVVWKKCKKNYYNEDDKKAER